MDLYEAIEGRRSIRRFEERPVEAGVLEKLVEAAHWAPYGTGKDQRHFLILGGEKKREFVEFLRARVEELMPALQEASPPTTLALARSVLPAITSAPALVVAFAELSEGGDLLAVASLAVAVENLLLAAYAEGLAGVWLTGATYLGDEIADHLELGRVRLGGLIAVGYPAKYPKVPPPRVSHLYWRGFPDRAEEPVQAEPLPCPSVVTPEAPAKVLVVDDTPAEREFLTQRLAEAGYEVVPCSRAEEARELVEKHRPDVVISDALLPGMTGYELARHLAENAEGLLPVLLMANSYTTSDEAYALTSGADAMLAKPVRGFALVAHLESLLRVKRLYDQVERQKRELEQLQEAQESLTYLIVHDLRTPLTSILGALRLVLDQEYDAEMSREMVPMAHRAGEVLLGLINDLLDVAKMEGGQLDLDREDFALGPILQGVSEVLGGTARDRGLELRAELPQEVWVKGDAGLTRRMLTNLVGNALKFTYEGSVTIGAEREGEQVALWVQDTGPGIAPEYRERIFEKFGQVDRERGAPRVGTGLGLTFVKMSAEAMGGSVRLDSEVGQGSRFTVLLPAGEAPAGGGA